MREFLKILLSLSFSGAFLFLLVFLFVQMYRNRLSRRWQYYIWLLVICRFLIPFTFTHTVTGTLFRGVEQAVAERQTADVKESVAEDAAERQTMDAAERLAADVPEKQTADVPPGGNEKEDAPENASGEAMDISFFLFGIWAAGALILLIRKITIYQSYMQFLRKGNVEVSDLETLNILADAMDGLKIKRSIELYRNPLITSPIMIGFIRPKIVIPDKKMTDGELLCVFTHELVHFKYLDMFYKWLVQITICIHWFNPFVYLLGKEVNKRCELSCDEKVIAALNEQERKDYGDTLLSFLKRGETYQSPLASITLTEGAEQLIERLGAIMDYRKKSKTIVLLTTALTVLLGFFFTGIGAYAGAGKGWEDAAYNAEEDDTEQDWKPENSTEAEKEGRSNTYSLLYDEEARTYYILLEGATLADRPVGGSVGGMKIVLVKKSGYTSFSFASYELAFGFLDRVESQCQDALQKEIISEAEADLIWEVAARIAEGEDVITEAQEEGTGQNAEALKNTYFSYFQQAYYREPYLIELGWNLGQEAVKVYAHTEILLNDQSRMSVYFAKEAEAWMSDAEAMKAVSRLVSELKPDARGKYGIKLELPYVSRIVYLPSNEMEDFAEQAFVSDEIMDFAAVVKMLPEEKKEEYCERSYQENDIAFFSIIISETNADYIRAFAERCYERDETDYFSIAVDDLSEKDREDLMKKTLREGNDMYYYILKNKEDWG